MNKVEIRKFTHAEVDGPKEPFGFMKIPAEHTLIRAEGENLEVSDGYHTMDELYDHRIELWIAICRIAAQFGKHFAGLDAAKAEVFQVWRSWEHADGSLFEGWFILGMGKKSGEQITYHIPAARWDDCLWAEFRNSAPEWDGHSSADVLERLKNI